MYQNKINLTPQDILDKEFKIDTRGYRLKEVDQFLDIVISDYSSLMFDFILSFKPCFQFATDIEQYKNDRNFYFDLEKLPFDSAISNEELINKINAFNSENYLERISQFFEEFGVVREGHSSKKCAELIGKIASGECVKSDF